MSFTRSKSIIWSISPKTKQKINVGNFKERNTIASFLITPGRIFHEAQCVGIDEMVFDSVRKCKFLVFDFKDGTDRNFRIKAGDFLANSWLYPSKDDPEYKANTSVFRPKMMIDINKLEEFSKTLRIEENRKRDLEILRTL